ncbi:hypothetical protein PM082_024792 [Marasmius tenuissimus]|nr:hypothetical protein PM082_024792 [Marasmius tenuissimus]
MVESSLLLSTGCLEEPQQCNVMFWFPIAVSCVLFLVYGIHVVLFGVSITVLVKRRRERFRIHCILLTGLFFLASVSALLSVSNLYDKLRSSNVVLNTPYIANEFNEATNLGLVAPDKLTFTQHIELNVQPLYNKYS